jgi:deoxyribodipyrimidine photolyase-related protein
MPDYASMNFSIIKKSYQNGFGPENQMHCLRDTINQSLNYGYAHHIQRLMITGNFALLAGINPDELDAWYLGIYIDAIEWVEITNTRG